MEWLNCRTELMLKAEYISIALLPGVFGNVIPADMVRNCTLMNSLLIKINLLP